jgi:hypothetical protein
MGNRRASYLMCEVVLNDTLPEMTGEQGAVDIKDSSRFGAGSLCFNHGQIVTCVPGKRLFEIQCI